MAHKIFIKIDTIRGESTAKGHKDEIEALAWNWSFSIQSSTGGGGGGAPKPTVSGISFSHKVDKASPPLMGACFTGKRLREAVLRIPTAKDTFDNYIIKTQEVIITSVVQSDKAEDEFPIEIVTYAFDKVTEEYTEIKQDGTPGLKTISCYDMKTNKPC